MQKTFLLALTAIIFYFFPSGEIVKCVGQNPLVKQWDYRFGGTSSEEIYSMQQTADNGYILGGYSTSGISGDKTQPIWGGLYPDYWIVKLDSLGIKQWDKDFGGMDQDRMYSLQQTADKGYILGGHSNSGTGGDKTQASWGNNDYWIIKIDSSGNKQWDKDFGGTSNDELYSIQQTSDGGYILGGYSYSDSSGDKTQNTQGYQDYWIVKTDSLGNKQWDKNFGGTNEDQLYAVKQTHDGGYILAGWSSSLAGGDKTQDTWGSKDYWIIKTDSLGNKKWDKDFGGTSYDYCYAVHETFNGGYIIGGNSASDSGGNKSQVSWGATDYWIIKIDSLGNKQWDKDFGGTLGDYLNTIKQTNDGGYLLTGYSTSDSSGNKTENNLSYNQTWAVKTDSNGNKQWDKTLHTLYTGGAAEGNGLGIQLGDSCYGMANFTPAGIGGDKTQPNWGTSQSYDYWIIKFCDSTTTTSIPQLPDTQLPFSIYPNPANETLVVSGQWSGKKEIEIYDLFGRTVLQSSIYNLQSSIDISTLFPGIYFIKAGNEVRKFVKE